MLTTVRPLLARLADPATLQAAWERIKAKGAHGGLDHVSIEEFAGDSEARLAELRRELLEERYVPEPLQQIVIPKGTRGQAPLGGASPQEWRTLGLPTVRDKIAQEAVRSVLEPLFERRFLDCNYGYRPGKGPHRAIGRVTHYLTNLKRRWIVTADIDNFFASLDHARLLDQLRPVLQDEAVLRLIELWLKIGAVDAQGRWHDVASGVSQGGVISPLLANFYLHPFDQHMTEHGFGLVRYADDFVILCAERAEAEDALFKATAFLTTPLSLRLNPNPHPIATVEQGFAFLGIFFHHRSRKVDRAKLEQIRTKIAQLTAGPYANDWERGLHAINEAIVGWRRYYGRLVEPVEIEKIERLTQDGLIQLLGTAFRNGRLKTIAEAEAALQHLELMRERRPEDRRALIADLARAARSSAAWTAAQGQIPPGDAQKGVSPQSQSPPSVANQIRRKKRRHLRRLAQVSELVVTTPGSFLGKRGQRIVVRQARQTVCEVLAQHLTGLTVATHGVCLSSDVIHHCAEQTVPLLFLSPQGKVSALLSAPETATGALGLHQLEALSKGDLALGLAKRFVHGKIANQMNLMKYCHKYRKQKTSPFAEAFPRHLEAMAQLRQEVEEVHLTDTYELARNRLFSLEGRAAGHYWDLIGLLIQENGHVTFSGRERKGATDLVNSLLNYGYALLHNRVYLAVLKAGLMPQVSFLHALQKDKPTLVYDLMEEFRPQIVDRTVLTMIARREPIAVDEQGKLTEETRRRLITRIQDRLATLIRFRGRELKLDEVIQHQAQLLVRHLKGAQTYRPFVGKW